MMRSAISTRRTDRQFSVWLGSSGATIWGTRLVQDTKHPEQWYIYRRKVLVASIDLLYGVTIKEYREGQIVIPQEMTHLGLLREKEEAKS